MDLKPFYNYGDYVDVAIQNSEITWVYKQGEDVIDIKLLFRNNI